MATMIDNRTAKQWESTLCSFSPKTSSYEKFLAYVVQKNLVSSKILKVYQDPLFRKMKWWTYVNRRRSEDRNIHRFKEMYGGPESTIIAWGDWSSSDQALKMKNHQPAPHRRLIRTFRKSGYNTYLVREHYTSKRCNQCQNKDSICGSALKITNPRPGRSDKKECHGLRECKCCGTKFDRDVNSSTNIMNYGLSKMSGFGRPSHLCDEHFPDLD